MEERVEYSLKDLLESVAFTGYASVPKWRLTRWYGQYKFAVGIRRDLRARWKALIEKELQWSQPALLGIAEIEGDVILINQAKFFSDEE